MASYFREDPLQSYQFTPYQEDYSGILKTLQVKEQYWKIGVQKVKSAYEMASGMSLTGERNKLQHDEFMKNADDQLKKSMASDLSIQNNAANAINIYKPLYDPVANKEMLADHKRTVFNEGEKQKMQQDMQKEGGKNFNPNNARYLMMQIEDFEDHLKNGGNASEYKGNSDGYIPYYNSKDEFDDILKNCKPDKTSSTKISKSSNLYLESESNNSLALGKLYGCLQSGLTSKAYSQIAIDAYVGYNKDYNKVAEDFAQTYSESVQQLKANKLYALDEKLKSINELAKNPNDEVLKQRVQYFTEQEESLKSSILENEKVLNKLQNGDLSYIKDNYSQITRTLGVQSKLGGFSKFFSYKDIKEDIEANSVQLVIDKMRFEESENEKNRKLDRWKTEQNNATEIVKKQMDINSGNTSSNGGNKSNTSDGFPDQQDLTTIPLQNQNPDDTGDKKENPLLTNYLKGPDEALKNIKDIEKLEEMEYNSLLYSIANTAEGKKLLGSYHASIISNKGISERGEISIYISNLLNSPEVSDSVKNRIKSIKSNYISKKQPFKDAVEEIKITDSYFQNKIKKNPDLQGNVTITLEDGTSKTISKLEYYQGRSTEIKKINDTMYGVPSEKTINKTIRKYRGQEIKKISDSKLDDKFDNFRKDAFNELLDVNKTINPANISKDNKIHMAESIKPYIGNAQYKDIEVFDINVANGSYSFRLKDNDGKVVSAKINDNQVQNHNITHNGNNVYTVNKVDMSQYFTGASVDFATANKRKWLIEKLANTLEDGANEKVLYGDSDYNIYIVGSRSGNHSSFYIKEGNNKSPIYDVEKALEIYYQQINDKRNK